MATGQTRRSMIADRDGSFSSNRSFDDYDTDEIRRRWRIKPAERAPSLTREEARDIIDRQSLTNSYTGYTYGDSISYRKDGDLEYLHPHLNHRKYVDFGAGGDVTSYKIVGTRPQTNTPFYTPVWNCIKENAWTWLTVSFLSIFRFLLIVVQAIATFGIFLGGLVYAAQQKISTFASKKWSAISAAASPPKPIRSSRNRMHVSFATSPEVEPQISFRQTSTPITSTPAPSILSPHSIQKKSEPLHVYAWNGINYVWESTKNVFEFVQETLHSTYDWATDRFISGQPQTPHKRRGRPPKNAQAHESRLAPLKAQLNNGATWAVDKVESGAENVSHLSWRIINQIANTTTYIQNKFTSANKGSNWWPYFLLLSILMFSTALYALHNKVNNDRDLTTALHQDGQVVRQWAKSRVVNAYNSIPSISGIFGSIGEQFKAFFWSIRNFFVDVYKTVTNGLYHNFNAVRQWIGSTISSAYNSLPNVTGIFGRIAGRVKAFFLDIGDLFVSIYYSTINALYQGGQTVRQWFNSLTSGIYNSLPNVSNFFPAIVERVKDAYSAIEYRLNRLDSAIRSFFGKLYQSVTNLDIVSPVYRGFQAARQWIVSVVLSAYNWLPNFSEFFSVVSDQVHHVAVIIRQFFVNIYHSATNWAYKPSVIDHPTDPEPIREKLVERIVIHDNEIDLNEVKKLIREQISLYDADKTGQPDYALESSGGSVVGIGCTKVYQETSRLQAIFGISLYFSNYGPRTVIQRRANSPIAGECWAYEGGHGQLQIQLSHKIDVKSVSYEHLSPRLSPEGHMKTAPKDFRVWSIQNHKKSDERKHLLGEFVYLDNIEALQNFEVQFPDENLTEVLEFETTTNHGSPVTCLYRFRVHGKPPLFPAEPI